jgi:hypothetical protein
MAPAARIPAAKAHALLATLMALPHLVHVPYSLNIVLHAALTVYVGSWRSLHKGEEGGEGARARAPVLPRAPPPCAPAPGPLQP